MGYCMVDDSRNADQAIGLATKVLELASDSPELREAGRTIGKSALTLARAVDNVLVPIAAVNFAFDKARVYFETKFKKDLEAAAEDIPPEAMVEPKASIAAPALQGLAFSHEEPDLKSMYLNLLATAMDGRRSHSAHPAYAEIIRQLAADEAKMFNNLIGIPPNGIPIVTLKDTTSLGIRAIQENIMNVVNSTTGKPIALANMQFMIDNWVRLGLISITYRRKLLASGSYAWVQERPEYIELNSKRGKLNSKRDKVEVEEGILQLSALGKAFAKAVSSSTVS